MIKKLFFTLLFALMVNVVFSQEIITVYGHVVDENNNPIAFAHVVNQKRKLACISDTSGNFRISMLAQDSLKISCMGFNIGYFAFRDFLYNQELKTAHTGDLVLIAKVFEHQVVSVYQQRWLDFLYDYEHKEIESDKQTIDAINRWKENIVNTEQIREISQASRGFGFALNFDRSKIKQQKKIDADKKQEELNQLAFQRYNPDVISTITGMDKEQSFKFMLYYNLDRDFILQRNDYDLYLIITQLYEHYKNENN